MKIQLYQCFGYGRLPKVISTIIILALVDFLQYIIIWGSDMMLMVINSSVFDRLKYDIAVRLMLQCWTN